ncbi:MAG: type II toxin-antitoxin system HicA family toxin [Candidatus Accumulibacter sp.]|jgi:predicted RNA binding protein YcfA (HicA-like mRNA interferase family)|nr:type II toxin-antitoxin system HicA family toxin [Accumulibacter sp.]
MSKQGKRLATLTNEEARMTWAELVALLGGLGYRLVEGKGSRVKFEHDVEAPINLHRPHPGNEIKAYVRRLVLEHLKERKQP